MGRGSWCGRMAESTWVSTKMIKNTEWANLHGVMEESTMVNGVKVDNTVLASTRMKKVAHKSLFLDISKVGYW